MVSPKNSDLHTHEDARSVYQNAKTAAERAFHASRDSAIVGARTHDGKQYHRLERSTRSDGQGSHLARSKSLRGPKKAMIDGKTSYQRPRLRMQVSFPKFIHNSYASTSQPSPSTPTFAERKAEACFFSCHREDTTLRKSPCTPVVQAQKWEMAQPLAYAAPLASNGKSDTSRNDFALRSQVQSTPDRASSLVQLGLIQEPATSQRRARKSQQLHEAGSTLSFSNNKKCPSKLHKAKTPSTRERDASGSERPPSGVDDNEHKPRTFRRTLERIAIPLRNIYSRKASRATSAQSQLPPQHIEARRSHVFSTETIRKLNEAALIAKLSESAPNGHQDDLSTVPTTQRLREHPSHASFKLPLNGQHMLQDLDGTSHHTSRLTSWADSSALNTTMGRPSLQVLKERQAVDDVTPEKAQGLDVNSTRSSRRLRIPRRRSSISSNRKIDVLDSQRVYSALLKRIGGTEEAGKRQDRTHSRSTLYESTGSLGTSSQQTILMKQMSCQPDRKPTVRLVHGVPESQHEQNPRTVASGHPCASFGAQRNDVISPSIYSAVAFDSVERLESHSLPRMKASTGTAIVSQSQPAAVWTLGTQPSGRASPAPNTSSDWREWTSKAMMSMSEHRAERQARLCSFSNPWLVDGRESGDLHGQPQAVLVPNRPSSRQQLRAGEPLQEQTLVNPPQTSIATNPEDEEVDDPFNDPKKQSHVQQPRFPSRIGGDEIPRRRPLTLQSGSPMNDRFLRNIRKGPWGIASPDGSPERTKKAQVQRVQSTFMLQNENFKPTGGQQMAEEFLKDRMTRGNSSSPVFL